MKKYLIVGLGNIGDKYLLTRHNVGFLAVDAFAKQQEIVFESERFGDIATTRIKGRQIHLLKPDTYMNLSGHAVLYWIKRLKVSPENILIITDDIHLPFGTFRLKLRGSDGGHNGLKNIQEVLQSGNYPRFRFGVGGDFQKGQQVKYVLGNWSNAEMEHLNPLLYDAQEAIVSFVLSGPAITMNTYNGDRIKSCS